MTNKISQLKKIACAAGVVLLLAGYAHADIVATYDFTGGSLAPTTELFAGTAGDIVLGDTTSAITADSMDDFLTALSADVGTAIVDANNGLSFNYTVMGLAAGETLNLDSASIDYTGFVGSVRVGFNDAGTPPSVNPADGNGTFTTAPDITPDPTPNLTSTGLVNGDVVNIRFGFRDNDAGGQTYTLDNLVLNGTVVTAVPEPSSSLVLFAAGFGMIGFRRRRLK